MAPLFPNTTSGAVMISSISLCWEGKNNSAPTNNSVSISIILLYSKTNQAYIALPYITCDIVSGRFSSAVVTMNRISSS